MILRRRIARARGSFHFLLAVFLSNDGQACGECSESIYVIGVAMSDDYSGNRLGRKLGDFGKHLPGGIGRRFRIDHNDAILPNNNSGVAAGAALRPVNVRRDLLDGQRWRLLLSVSRNREEVQSTYNQKSYCR